MEKPLSYPNQQISIHVPSWGTTRSLFDLPFPLPISIHVPSWGTTSMLAGCGKAYPFQSTFPRGERRFLRGGSRLVSYFNPRSLVGNDDFYEEAAALYLISIHVPSWGTTISASSGVITPTYFNPRSLVGNDGCRYCNQQGIRISIHVPSWGTTYVLTLVNIKREFQSTFPRGERLSVSFFFLSSSSISIHVPSWGTTNLPPNR